MYNLNLLMWRNKVVLYKEKIAPYHKSNLFQCQLASSSIFVIHFHQNPRQHSEKETLITGSPTILHDFLNLLKLSIVLKSLTFPSAFLNALVPSKVTVA